MKTVKLKKKEERRILRGHPWVFSNELERSPAECAPGEIVDVLDNAGRFIGRGNINPHSLIAVRLLTRTQEEINGDFFRRRIAAARSLRTMLGFGDSFRAVFSEGDGLPGLIVDKYADTLVVQSSTAGIDGMLNEILAALQEEYAPTAIVLRNDTASREIEGLARETRVVHGAISGTGDVRGIRHSISRRRSRRTEDRVLFRPARKPSGAQRVCAGKTHARLFLLRGRLGALGGALRRNGGHRTRLVGEGDRAGIGKRHIERPVGAVQERPMSSMSSASWKSSGNASAASSSIRPRS